MRPRSLSAPWRHHVSCPRSWSSSAAGKFAWVGGGGHLTSTAHVDNVVEGLVLAAEKGHAGEAYFITDGEPIAFREMITAMVATEGAEPGKRNVPAGLAMPAAAAMGEAVWRALWL